MYAMMCLPYGLNNSSNPDITSPDITLDCYKHMCNTITLYHVTSIAHWPIPHNNYVCEIGQWAIHVTWYNVELALDTPDKQGPSSYVIIMVAYVPVPNMQ